MWIHNTIIIGIAVIFVNVPAYSQKATANYSFDNTANDKSGYNNNGTIHGGVKPTYDRFGNPCGALNFNGIDGYIEIPSTKTLESIVDEFSVTVWFKIESSQLTPDRRWLTLICKGNEQIETENNPQYRVQALQMQKVSTISINTDFTENDNDFQNHLFEYGVWNFYSLVYDGKTVKTFLNTKEIWAFPYAKKLVPNKHPLHIAKDIPGSTEYFCGALDDLRIFNKAIDTKELNEIYNESDGNLTKDEFIMECTKSIKASTDKNNCGAIVNYDKPIVTPLCGTPITEQILGLKSGEQFPLGQTLIAYRTTGEYNLKKGCDFIITVIDDMPPVINCPSDTIIYSDDVSSNGKNVDYQNLKTSDNCGIKEIKLIEGLASNSFFPLGINTIKYEAIDESGNKSYCSFNIEVRQKNSDIKPPITKAIVKEDTITNQKQMTEPLKVDGDTVNIEYDISFNDCTITAVMYDDGEEDNDTVSIFFNGKLIVDKEMIMLKENKTIIKAFVLNPDQTSYLVSKAWNTGTVGLNTLKIEFYEGNLLKDIKSLKRKKPQSVKIIHSRPGMAGAVKLKCKL